MAATSRGSATNAGRRAATATIGVTRKLLGGIQRASRRPITSTPAASGSSPTSSSRLAQRGRDGVRVAGIGLAAGKRDLARVVVGPVLDALGEDEVRLAVGAGVDEDEGGRRPGVGRRRRPLERDAVGQPLRAQPRRRRRSGRGGAANAGADVVGRHPAHRYGGRRGASIGDAQPAHPARAPAMPSAAGRPRGYCGGRARPRRSPLVQPLPVAVLLLRRRRRRQVQDRCARSGSGPASAAGSRTARRAGRRPRRRPSPPPG